MEICPKHQGDIKYLIMDPNTIKLACTECRDEKIYDGFPPNQCLLISKVLKQPEILLSNIKVEPVFKLFFSNILKISSDDLQRTKTYWIDQFRKAQIQLDQLIQETIVFFDFLSQSLNDYRNELKRLIRFNTFEQYIKANLNGDSLEQMTSVIRQKTRQEINTQIELKIQDYINSINKECNEENKRNLENLIKDYKNKIINAKVPTSVELSNSIRIEFEKFQVIVQEKIQLANPQFSRQSSLLSTQNFQNMLFKITQQQNPNCSLVYQGTIDGLDSIRFWNKIQNKSNLLMIMKSKNNQSIFGGYTPCQWLKSPQPQFMTDEKGTSFLFIQNPIQQIQYYHIKNEFKNQAIAVNQSFGPLFGKNDLQIFADFKEGFLSIGSNYQKDPREIQTAFTLGPKLAEIIEFEVFEL